MSRHLFSVFPLLLMILWCICGPAYAEDSGQTNSVELFIASKTKVPFKKNNEMTQKDVKYFYPLFLLGADGVIVAFAATDYNAKENIDIAAKYIGTKGENWAERAMEKNGGNWETQLAIQNEVQTDFYVFLGKPMAITKDNKIYVLAANSNMSKSESQPWSDQNCGFVLAVGEVKTTDAGAGTKKKIEWKTSESASSKLTQQFKDKSLQVTPYGGWGYSFLLKDGKIVFVLGVVKEEKYFAAIIHLNVTGEDVELELAHLEPTESYAFPSFFEWEGKLIMSSDVQDGGYKVKESTDMGNTWTDTVWPFSCLWTNLQDKGDFTTVTIEAKKVLLFTQPRFERTGSQLKYEIYLWMTDGKRVLNVGPIVDHNGYVGFGGLLYTVGELFFLHQSNNNNQAGNILLTRLNDELEKIKSVLKTWEAKDVFLSRPCNETTPQGTLSENPCVTPMPTEGLVGFLSNTTSGDNNNIWVDEYFYVNATVKGGTKVDNGFTFSGTNSGAAWPVGLQGQSQRYDFARYGLTVVATVTIHEVPKSDSPLLTIGGVWEEKLVALWYDKDKQWQLRSMNSNAVSSGDWETNKSYRVALSLQKDSLSAYIDGNRLGDPLPTSKTEKWLLGIQHIFIGRYKKEKDSQENAEGHVTVTNVFLYNRPLNTTELEALEEKRPETPDTKEHTGDTAELPRHTGDTAELPRHTGDTAELPRHTGDTAELPRHTEDTAELPKHTVQKNEANKQLQTILNLKNTGDGSLYMPVGTSLLCLLGLWGLAALC